MNKLYIGLGLAFVGGVALGGGAGYLAAVKRLDALYNEKMEEEIARTKDFYQRVFDKEDLETTAFKAGVGEATDALKSYQTVDTGTIFADQAVVKKVDYSNVKIKPEDLEVTDDPRRAAYDAEYQAASSVPVEKNIFDEGDELTIDKENRDTSKPYIIDIIEYMDTPDGYEQLELTYYAGDRALGDDKDEPVPDYNIDMLVGRNNLTMFGASDPDQPHILLVRNEKIKTDFEITHSDGSFAHEVAGFQHSDATFERTRARRRNQEE